MNTTTRFLKTERFRLLSVLILLTTLFNYSCVSHRNLEYLNVNDRNNETVTFFNEARISDYKLKPNDELYIQIKSLDDPSTNVFQQVGRQSDNLGYSTPFSASLMSYMIDKSGFIKMPFIGDMYVQDKTVPDVISMLTDSLNNFLSSPTVTVKLVNRYISVLGEVNNPGHYSYAQEKLTVFDALSLAGDITDYGDRNKVIIARNENGRNYRINIDLTSPKIMASEYYYIRPNDMIYVKPMRKKIWGLNEFPWQVLLSSISTAVLLYTVFGQPK